MIYIEFCLLNFPFIKYFILHTSSYLHAEWKDYHLFENELDKHLKGSTIVSLNWELIRKNGQNTTNERIILDFMYSMHNMYLEGVVIGKFTG